MQRMEEPENCTKQPKKITNKRWHQVTTVKNKRGKIIKDNSAKLERWAEHFEEVLVGKVLANPVEE